MDDGQCSRRFNYKQHVPMEVVHQLFLIVVIANTHQFDKQVKKNEQWRSEIN
jgi:hypothetical protein